ncbi:MAG: fibronectin type III domain-containing protein [Flavobacteriaceae bacterium]|nr:fibronectin type III domain-containing protein [Flavobacteriaceae bacterium]
MKRLCLIGLILAFIVSCKDDDEQIITQCEIPTNLSVSSISDVSATISWENTNDSQNVKIEYGIAGFLPGSGSIIEATQNSAIISGLNADTSYDFYVQAICATDNVSMNSVAGSFNTNSSPVNPEFLPNLSQLNLFTGNMADLTLSTNVFKYDLITPLFTDYAHKLRLIALPQGQAMEYDGEGFPIFPNGTVISKTFYYNLDETNLSLGKKIIETRVLIRVNGAWTIGNYVWNEAQTDAVLDENEHTVPISWVNEAGEAMSTNYIVPAANDCTKCHSNAGNVVAIGPKVRNMNFEVDGVNQLQKFIDAGHLTEAPSVDAMAVLPNWQDDTLPLESRSRAYFDVNCAHCHSPGGFCEIQSTLDLRFEIDFNDTKIYERRNSINNRMIAYNPGFSMPFIGTTMVHSEGYALIKAFLDTL